MPKTHRASWRSLVGILVLTLLPSAAHAVQHEVRILMDLDDDPGTGCLVNTVDGPFDGVEQILISTVETSTPPDAGVVTDVATSDCTDEVLDTFSAPASFDGGWPVGIGNGVGGRDVVETYFPLVASVVADPKIVRLGVVVTDELGGEQALLTTNDTPGGPDIILDLRSIVEIPTLGEWGLLLLALVLAGASLVLLGRRGGTAFVLVLVVLGAGVAWAAGTLDGLTDDWSASDQLATDGLVLFGKGAGGDLCFRVDVDLVFNQPPTITDIADQVIPEDGTTGALAFTVGDIESAANTLAVSATSSNQVLVADANLVLVGAGANRTITVTPAANQNGFTDVTVTVQDPDGGSTSTTFRVTVTSDNDPPTITMIADQMILEDGTTGPLAFTVGDVETPVGSLTVTASSNDTTIIPNANLVIVGAGANRTITVTPAADQNGGPVTITLTVMDADGGSVPEQFDVTVTPVNDAPSFTAGADQMVAEDAGAQNVPGWATAISAGPANEAGQTLTFNVTGNTNSGLFSAGPAINSGGDLSYTPATNANGSADVTIELMDDGGTANGGVDTSAAQTFTITVTAVNDLPVADDEIVSAACNVEDVVETAPGQTAAATGNVFRTIADNVLDGDSDPVEMSAIAIVQADGLTSDTTAPFQVTTNQGGTVTLFADGSFVYTPEGGDRSVADSFTYTIQDADGGQAVGTVTLNVGSICVWFVDNSVSATDDVGSGTSSDPFTSLVDEIGPDALADDAEDASIAGDVIYVFEGDSTGGDPYQGDFAAKANQRLLGQGVDLVVDYGGGPETLFTGNTANRPLIDDSDGDAVQVTDVGGVEVAGFELDALDHALQVVSTAAPVGLDFHDNVIVGSGTTGIDVNQGNGDSTVTLTDNTVAATGDGIHAAASAGTVGLAIDGNTGITSSGVGISLIDNNMAGTSLFVTSFCGNTVSGNTVGAGISAQGVVFDANPLPGGDPDFVGDQVGCTGTTTSVGSSGNPVGGPAMVLTGISGDLAFGTLDLYTDGMGAIGLDVTGTGPLMAAIGTGFEITSTGGTVSSTSGPAVVIDPASVGLTFTTLTSSNSPGTGVSLIDVTGMFSAGVGSSITGATGDAFQVFSTLPSPLGVTYGGTINNASAATVNVMSHPGGTLLFSGNLTATGGTGLQFSNADGDYAFLGTVALSNGDAGIDILADSAGTFMFANTSITNPSGTAFNLDASGPGILNYTGTMTKTNAGRLISINGHSGGLVSFFGGPLVESGATGTGVAVTNMTGAGVDFLAPIDLGLTTRLGNDAVTLTNNSGTTTFANLDVHTDNARAFVKTGGGSVTVTTGTVDVTGGFAGSAIEVSGGTSNVTFSDVDATVAGAGGVRFANTAGTKTIQALNVTINVGGTALFADTAGTLNVTGAANTIDATNAAAVEIMNTTIGASGVTLMSASSSGAANGIVLDTTGTTGPFMVTGDGSMTAGVLDRDGSGGSILNTTNDGVSLTAATGVTLRQMNIFDVGNNANSGNTSDLANDHAVQSVGGGGIVLSAVHIRNPIGSGWEAFDITGANRVDEGSLIEELDQTSNFAGIRVTNTNTSFTSFTIDNSRLDHMDPTPGDAATNGNAMVVLSTRGAVNGAWTASNSTFVGARGQAMTLNSGDTAGSTGTITTTISNNLFETSHPINGQNNLGIQALQGTTHLVTITGNTFQDVGRGLSNSGQIIVQKANTAVLDASISGNTIHNITAQRGIEVLALTTSTGGKVDAEIFNNVIYDVGREGIYTSARGSEPDMDVRIFNNTVGRTAPAGMGGTISAVGGQNDAAGVFVDAQAAAKLDVQIDGNEVIADTGSFGACGGSQCGVTTINVENFPSGTAVVNATVENNVFNNHDASGTNFLARARDCGLTLNVDLGGNGGGGSGGGDGTVNTATGTTTAYEILDDSFGCAMGTTPTVAVENLANVDNDNLPTGNVATTGTVAFGGDVSKPNF